MDVRTLFDIKGKTALVTGGSGGIGYMIAASLVRSGCRVFICSRRQAEIETAAHSLAAFGDVVPFAADLASPEGIASAVAAIGKDPLHILVNNAGATWGGPLDTFPRKGFAKVLDLNLVAPFELVKGLKPALCAAASAEDPARIINIASIDGMKVPEWESYPYSASKAGIIHLSRHLGKFLAPHHISVNSIAPGFFPSRMTGTVVDLADDEALSAYRSPFGGRVGTQEDIAGAVIYLASRAGAWLSGITIPVAGGVSTID